MNSSKGVISSPIMRRKRSQDKSVNLAIVDKLTSEKKEVGCSISKSIPPKKTNQKSDSIQLENRIIKLKKPKKTLSWKKSIVEIIDIHSYKSINTESANVNPSLAEANANCGCTVF